MIPSEMLEPVLVDAWSWCLRDLMQSRRTDDDWTIFRIQTVMVDRIATTNRSLVTSTKDGTGSHANLAAMHLRRQVQRLMELPLDERNRFLDEVWGELNNT